MSTYKELLQSAKEQLKQQGITDADTDAWYLLSHVFGIKRTDYILHRDENASEVESNIYRKLVKKRAEHVPLQQLTGTQEFMGLEFIVNKDVLIPRQDTELLVEEVLKVSNGREVLDLCTGSGCIIISLAKLGGPKRAVGSDLSEKALSVAYKNAGKLGVEVEFIESDILEQVEDCFDIIVSNPPYIPSAEIDTLMPEVRYHEPRLALDGSADGLEFYRRIAAGSKQHLKPGGYIFFEIGYNQGEDLRRILTREGFGGIVVKKDLCGLDRVVSAVRL